MAKNQPERIIDQQYTTRAVRNATGNASYTVINVLSHGELGDLGVDDHLQYLLSADAGGRPNFLAKWTDLTDGGNATAHTHSHTILSDIGSNTHSQIDTHISASDIHVAHSGVSVIAGDGLTGGGTIAADRTLAVAVANTIQAATAAGLSVEANAVRFTASYDPGANSSPLASSATGSLTLPLFVASTSITTPSLISASLAELSIASGADTVFNPTGFVRLASGKLIRSNTFTSGFAGSGWQIDDGIITASKISAEFDNLTIRGRLSVYELLVRQIRATNGSVFVSSTGKAKTVIFNSGVSYTITTDNPDNHGFLAGDLIRAQRFTGTGVYQCDLHVVSVSDIYTFTANLIAGDAPAVGMEFVRLGSSSDASRRGSVYLTADDSGAPFIDIVDGITSHSDWNSRGGSAGVKARFGRITGITGNSNEYGVWAGSGTGDTAQSFVASNAGVTLNNVVLDFKAGTSTVVMRLSPGSSAPFIALGSTLPTGPLVNDGIWMGKDTAYKFRVGTVSGGALAKGLYWDGADLIWKATNTSLDASGNLVAGSVTLSSAGVTSAATNDYSNNAAYKFTSSGVVTSGTFAYATTTETAISLSTNLWGGSTLIQDTNRNAYTRVGAYAISTKDATSYLEAEVRDAYGATVKLARIIASANGSQSSLDLNADTLKTNSKTIWHADMDADLLPSATETYNIGSSTKKWGTIYVGAIVADTIAGSLSGATWRNDATDMFIYSNYSGTRTLTIGNDGAGVMNLSLDGSITLVSGATVDGVDVSAHVSDANAHHARSHSITSTSDHTITASAMQIVGATATNTLGLLTPSSAGEANAHILATDANGYTQVERLGVGISPTEKIHVYSNAVDVYPGLIFETGAAANNGFPYIKIKDGRAAGADWNLEVGRVAAGTFGIYGGGYGTAMSIAKTTGIVTFSPAVIMSAGAYIPSPSRLGMGTQTPSEEIHIYTNSASEFAGIFIETGSSTVTAWPYFKLKDGRTSGGDWNVETGRNLGNLEFYTGAFGTVMTLSPGGNVGINRTDPNYTLDVSGTGRFSGVLYANSDLEVDGTAILDGVSARHIMPQATDTYDIGSATLWWRQQFVSQINAVVFAEQTIQLLGGWFLIPKDAGVLPAVASATTQIDFGKAMTVGNWIVIKAHDASGAIKTEYMTIGSLAGGTTYNVTRDVAGAHGTDPIWTDGTPYAVLGANGDGRIELNAYDTPRISMITQGAAYNAQTEVIRIGDLNGMPGISTQTWGAFIGDASQYLKYAGGVLTIAGNGSGLTSISGGNITTGSIAADKLNVTSLSAISANMGALTVDSTLTMGVGGSITAGNTILNSSGISLTIPSVFSANTAFKFTESSTIYGGLWAYKSGNNVSLYLQSNRNSESGVVSSPSGLSNLSLGAYSQDGYSANSSFGGYNLNSSGSVVKYAAITATATSSSSIVSVYADTFQINGYGILHTGSSVNASTLSGYTWASFALVGHNHSGVYAPVSHTHTFGDISGNGNISTTGTLTVASNADGSHTIGRAKINSVSSDAAYFSHFDRSSTTGYALSQLASGQTALNSETGTLLYFGIGGTVVGNFAPTYFFPKGFIKLEEISTAPGTGDLSSGTQGSIYIKDDRFEIAFRRSDGSMRYFGVNLAQDVSVGTVVNFTRIA